jgi:hypothetical protein
MDNENTTALVGLQQQLNTIRSEVFSTNTGLQNIAGLIQTDSFLDQQRLREEREQERILAEREVRIGQEEQLQQRISSSLVQPVKKLESKLTSTFEGITSSLKYLFTTVLGVQLLKSIKIAIIKSGQALSNIGTVVRSSFGFITGAFSNLRSGIGSVVTSISNVTQRVSKSAIDLAKSPFKAISEIFKNLFKGGKSTASTAGSAAVESTDDVLKGLSSLFKGVGGTALRVGGTALGAVATAQNIKEGDIPGAVLSGAATVPSPIQLPAALGSIGYEMMTGGGIKSDKSILPENFSLPNFDFSKMKDNIMGSANLDIPAEKTYIAGVDQSKSPKVNAFVSQIETPKLTSPNIGPIPEAAPDLIYLQSGQRGGQNIAAAPKQTLTDVPLIPSKNSDNFYTLYSQLNYNVV